jgi:hypothetical protein
MESPAAADPVLDDQLLDELARVFMRAALDELLREQQQHEDKCAADPGG